MAHLSNQISLYKKLNEESFIKAGVEVGRVEIVYYSQGEEKNIALNEQRGKVIRVNEFDSMWSPIEHNLIVKQKILFRKPAVFYGADGVTMPGNKIGLAVHMHSIKSKFQKTIRIDTIPNSYEEVEISFYHEFPVSSIRGEVKLDLFVFLEEYKEYNAKHATMAGMILSETDIENLIIVIDGEGSAFPMTEFEEKDGPLWRLDNRWADAVTDSFDFENVNLSLNVIHPLFEQVKAGKTRISRALMGDILVQTMSTIIHQVIIIEECSLDDVNDEFPGSILAAVEYWVSTFGIDTSSLFSITNTMREYWDKEMIQGGEVDD